MHKKEVVTLDSAFSAMTADVITKHFFGEDLDYLDVPDFKNPIADAFLGVSYIFHFARFIPTLIAILRKLPIPVIRMIVPSIAELLELQVHLKQKINTTPEDEIKKEHKSIISSIMENPSIPPVERDLDRMVDEGTLVIFAGTETSSRAISVGMFYLLQNKAILKNLRKELSTLPFRSENDYSLAQLEPLPYLVSIFLHFPVLLFSPSSKAPLRN